MTNKNLTINELFDLAVKNHQENKTDIAQNFYNQVLKINPNHSPALNNLGAIFQNFGNIKKSKYFFEKAVEINPEYADAQNNLGTIFSELRNHQKAEDCYKKAIKINSNYKDAYYNLALTYKDLGEFQKSVNCFENAIRIDSNHMPSISSLASLFRIIKFSYFSKEQRISYKKLFIILFRNNNIDHMGLAKNTKLLFFLNLMKIMCGSQLF